MSTIDNGGAAFPAQPTVHMGRGVDISAHHGMTLRDYFAAAALPAVIGTTQSWRNLDFVPTNGLTNSENDALCAYQVADAMLKARVAATKDAEVSNG